MIAPRKRQEPPDRGSPRTAEGLSLDAVLDAAESELRRFGAAKTTVVDVARKLGITHGSVYRYILSKTDLRNAVSRPLAAASLCTAGSDCLRGRLRERATSSLDRNFKRGKTEQFSRRSGDVRALWPACSFVSHGRRRATRTANRTNPRDRRRRHQMW